MRKSLQAGLAAAALLAAPSLAVAQEPAGGEMFISLGHIVVPGTPLASFDISWVDTDLNLYLLADRSNASVDSIPIVVNPPVFKILPTGVNAFAGNVPTCPIANACNGPNGILTLNNPNAAAGKELWAGDGPTINPVCGGDGISCSTVKVFNTAAVLTHTINTGGVFRADELCFAPPNAAAGHPNGIILIANDADSPPFVSFIATDGPNAYKVLNTVQYPQASNGIEQCQWDRQTGLFYLNLPEVNGPGDDSVDGQVRRLSAVTLSDVGGFDVDVTKCAGPQGMAIGPRPGTDILLGCNAGTQTTPPQFNSVIINDFPPLAINTVLFGQGGADQVWFEDIVGQHYFITGGSLLPTQTWGVTDANARDIDQNITIGTTGGTTRRAHSTAGWSGSPPGLGTSVTAAFVPIPPNGGTPLPPFSSPICGSDGAQGCVAVFATIPIPTNTAENPPAE